MRAKGVSVIINSIYTGAVCQTDGSGSAVLRTFNKGPDLVIYRIVQAEGP